MTTATAHRSKLELYASKLAELEAEAARLEAEIAANSEQREDEVRLELLRSDPSHRPDARSETEKIRRRRETAARKLEVLTKNLGSYRVLFAEAEAAANAEQVKALAAEGEKLRDLQREAVRELGKAFAELVTLYRESFKPATEVLNAWRESHAYLAADPDVFRSTVGRFAIEPAPVDFGAVLAYLTDATLDVHGVGFRQGSPLDDFAELVELVPNLIGQAPPIEITRGARKTSSSGPPVNTAWAGAGLDSGFGKSWSGF